MSNKNERTFTDIHIWKNMKGSNVNKLIGISLLAVTCLILLRPYVIPTPKEVIKYKDYPNCFVSEMKIDQGAYLNFYDAYIKDGQIFVNPSAIAHNNWRSCVSQDTYKIICKQDGYHLFGISYIANHSVFPSKVNLFISPTPILVVSYSPHL